MLGRTNVKKKCVDSKPEDKNYLKSTQKNEMINYSGGDKALPLFNLLGRENYFMWNQFK